jgi:hypothetical protein
MLSTRRIWIARAVAAAADVIQIALFPIFSPGLISPIDDIVDLLVCVILFFLIGWHMALIPSFLVKVLPVADLAPTWTIAVAIATWGKKAPHLQAPTQK